LQCCGGVERGATGVPVALRSDRRQGFPAGNPSKRAPSSRAQAASARARLTLEAAASSGRERIPVFVELGRPARHLKAVPAPAWRARQAHRAVADSSTAARDLLDFRVLLTNRTSTIPRRHLLPGVQKLGAPRGTRHAGAPDGTARRLGAERAASRSSRLQRLGRRPIRSTRGPDSSGIWEGWWRVWARAPLQVPPRLPASGLGGRTSRPVRVPHRAASAPRLGVWISPISGRRGMDAAPRARQRARRPGRSILHPGSWRRVPSSTIVLKLPRARARARRLRDGTRFTHVELMR